jgi:hypothetical protein
MPALIADAVSPEMHLLLGCARRNIAQADAEKIRALVAGPLDWNALRVHAARNALTPLLARHIQSVAPDAPAMQKIRQLCDDNRANALRCLKFVAALLNILDRLRQRGIPALPYKGPVLAVQAYGDVALRQFDDLDIVLRQRDMPAAHELMLSLGYSARFDAAFSPGIADAPIPGEYKYYDESGDTIAELHTELTLRHFPVEPNLDEFFERSITLDLSGRPVRTFSPEDALVAICIHGSKDLWSRISWVADVSELIRSHPQLDWTNVLRRAESLEAQRMLHLGLILAVNLLAASLPEEIVRRLRRDTPAQAVARGLAECLVSATPLSMSATKRFHFRRRMVPGFVSGWRYAGRLSLTPADEDWRALRLPRPFAPFYPLLRPLRLLQKYGWAGDRGQRRAK